MTAPAAEPPTPAAKSCRWCRGQRRPAGFLGRYLLCPTCDLHPTPKEPSS